MNWDEAISYAAAYDDGTNTDYRLITKSEALAILTNNALLSKLGLTGLENFWTIEELETENAYYFDGIQENVSFDDKTVNFNVLPVRKVNFYGLPLIESQFGGGLVYDVVAETRTVNVVCKPAEWGDFNTFTWENANGILPVEINEVIFTALPTQAQALKIFGNSYLVTLAGLPLDNDYWTSEEDGADCAYSYSFTIPGILSVGKSDLIYALPVRSEVVPET